MDQESRKGFLGKDSRLGWGPEPGGRKRTGLKVAALFSWQVAIAYCAGKIRPHRAARQLCEVSKAMVVAGGDPMARKDDYEIIFRPYIRKNGKIIRPKKGKVFPIKVRKKR